LHTSSETPSVTDLHSTVSSDVLLKTAQTCLDENKAEEIVSIDLAGKSGIADHIVIANGRSQRQVSALCAYVVKSFKELGHRDILVQGLEQSDWVLIDAGDIIVHIFRPEVRSFYNLDKMWSSELEAEDTVN
tara:strand:+ start:242 stop:637 length:396 start_codon:yes stop_codon:yes gene_type:complete